MAENYFPKSSQVGQGGAQVLSGRTPQVDMSNYTRGLENLATGIQQNIEYKRGVEALKQKEKNAQIASLNENITELQIPTFKKLAKQEFNNFWESVNKGEDWQPAFNTVMENISSLQAADNSMVKDRDKILEGEFRYEDGTRLQGGEVYSGLFEKEVPEDIMSIYKEGGVEAVVGSVLENTSTMSPNYYEQFKGGFDFNNEIGKYWATKLKNQGVESAKQIELGTDLTAAKVYRSLDGDDAIKAKSELLKDEAAKEFYFRNTALPYKTMNPEEKQKMWEEVVEQMIPPSTVDITAIRNKPEEGGGSREKKIEPVEVYDQTIDLNLGEFGDDGEMKSIASKEYKSIPIEQGTSNYNLTQQTPVFFMQDVDNFKVGDKAPKDFNLSAVKVSEIVDIKDSQTVLTPSFSGNDDPNKKVAESILERNSNISGKGAIGTVDGAKVFIPYNENTKGWFKKNFNAETEKLFKEKKEEKVLFYQTPDGTRYTPEEVEGIIGNIPDEWEEVTESNKAEMDANRPSSATKDTTTRQDLNEREAERRGVQKEKIDW